MGFLANISNWFKDDKINHINEKKTRKTKQFNFNMSEWFIILLLQDKPGLRLKEISKKYNQYPQRIYYVIKKLKDKEVLEVKKDPDNGREALYYLKDDKLYH